MARAFGPSNDKACCACGGGPEDRGLWMRLGAGLRGPVPVLVTEP